MSASTERTQVAAVADEVVGLIAPRHRWGRRLLDMESFSVLIATLVLLVLISVLRPGFFALSQLMDVLQTAAYVGIMACGMAFLLAMREIDLSVGAIFGLSLNGAAFLIRHGMDPWLAGLMGVAAGGVMGLGNAVVVQFIRIPTIVVTLATLSMYRGLTQALTNGQQITALNLHSTMWNWLGGKAFGVVPCAALVMLAVLLLLTGLLRLTPFGYRVRAIGSNPEAAVFSGIPVARVRVQALVMMGALAGLAGILGLAFFESADPNIGTGMELQAIAAAIIGGTALRGGNATAIGAVIGAILLTLVTSGLVYFNIPLNWSQFATGAVILIAVSIDSVVRRRRASNQELGL